MFGNCSAAHGSFLRQRPHPALRPRAAAPAAVTEGFQVALAVGAGITVLAMVAALAALPRRRRGRPVIPEPATESARATDLNARGPP
jgi:hypothetical protein